MARNRKIPQPTNADNATKSRNTANLSSNNRDNNSSSSSNSKENGHASTGNGSSKKFIAMSSWYVAVGVASIAVVGYFVYFGYLETRVNTPFDEQKIIHRSENNAESEKFWGTYRSHTYFSLKTRDPKSLVTGLMWYFPTKLRSNGDGLRHWCKLEDKLDKYGWLHHDGKNFGIQEIHDNNHIIETSFIKFYTSKFGGEWSARVKVTPKNPENKETLSLIWYTALDERSGFINPALSKLHGIEGETAKLGHFKISLHNTSGSIIQQSYLTTVTPNLQMIDHTMLSNLRLASDKATGNKYIVLAGDTVEDRARPNFVAIQLTVLSPFTLDITYQGRSNTSFGGEEFITLPIGEDYTKLINKKRRDFELKFKETYELEKKGYSSADIAIAQAALSNMLGSIGYFYGTSRVQSIHTNGPVPYWKAPLLTAVPSRSFFPRGFLWDEGFHGLLISSWDIDLELEILGHWLDLMNIEGWIPREQILGIEALAKVPEQFVTQHNTNGNPPTFFLMLRRLLDKYPEEMMKKNRVEILDRMFPRLNAWFNWYNNTQKGELSGSYRWRGRDDISIHELNPKTLTSGLDDYPRATHPTINERHIDLRCWIALSAGVMVQLGQLLGKNTEKYEETFYYLTDNKLLHELHYSSRTKSFADYGLHTDAVKLERPPAQPITRSGEMMHQQQQQQQQQQQDKIRVIKKEPQYGYVDTSFGYVALFPFLLQILDANSPTLGTLLNRIRDENELWTKYGLRSLSKTSPFYMKRNTEHDPPYWRGQIWININYLVLKSLYHYMNHPECPYTDNAKEIYNELRHNVVTNIIKQYRQTGYIWEQYNDETGNGSGCYPFTGWSALFVLIMSEKY